VIDTKIIVAPRSTPHGISVGRYNGQALLVLFHESDKVGENELGEITERTALVILNDGELVALRDALNNLL
jgi:hypothetical protein